MWSGFAHKTLWCKLFETQNPIANLRQKTCRNAAGRARGHYGAGSALQGPHTARPNQSKSPVGMASTNPRGGSMGLQGPPCAVLSPLVADPPDAPGDPESSRIKSITPHFPCFPWWPHWRQKWSSEPAGRALRRQFLRQTLKDTTFKFQI